MHWRAWLSAAALVFAQAFAGVHAISHATGHANDGDRADRICVTCVALSSVNGAPPPVHAKISSFEFGAIERPAPAPSDPRPIAPRNFRSRAPPDLPN